MWGTRTVGLRCMFPFKCNLLKNTIFSLVMTSKQDYCLICILLDCCSCTAYIPQALHFNYSVNQITKQSHKLSEFEEYDHNFKAYASIFSMNLKIHVQYHRTIEYRITVDNLYLFCMKLVCISQQSLQVYRKTCPCTFDASCSEWTFSFATVSLSYLNPITSSNYF